MVDTFVVTWNPVRWSPDELDYEHDLRASFRGETVRGRWSMGSRKSGVGVGDRVFRLRQRESRGIVASGSFVSEIFEDEHWEDPKETATYAEIAWDVILPHEERLPVEALNARVADVVWDRIQGSGVLLPAKAAREVEKMWSRHLQRLERSPTSGPDDLDSDGTYPEGAIQRTLVNRFERDRNARRACIAHHGLDCVVCGFNFGRAYGRLGEGLIHVHHLRELSSVGEGYSVDPIRDLRPVCANCHVLIHRNRPAMRIDEVKRLLAATG